MLAAPQFALLRQAIQEGLHGASQGLRTLTTGRMDLDLELPAISFLPLAHIPGIAGGPAAVVTAVYLGVEGDLRGHLMLLFTRESACRVVDLLLGRPPGTPRALDPLALSALAEAGNICGSGFLNAVANRTGLKIIPSPPQVVTDMAGAILEQVVAELYLAGEEVLVVETGFSGGVRGHFLLIPEQDSMARLAVALESAQ